MFTSFGQITYVNDWFTISVDEDLSRYYLKQIPLKLNRQKYKPHITIAKINKLDLNKLCLFDIYERFFPNQNIMKNDISIGKLIEFQYDHYVFNNEIYYWLNAYSKELTEFRSKIDSLADIWMPPDGTKCFHITLGNLKGNNGSAMI